MRQFPLASERTAQASCRELEPKSLDRIPLWHWFALLAFDTPAVTALWLALFAEVLHVPLEGPHYMVVFGAVWLFLIFNRSVRALWNGNSESGDPRIVFFNTERWPLLTLSPFVLISLVIIAATRMSWLEQAGLFLVGACAAVYLVCGLFYFQRTESLLPREIAHALFTTSLVALFVLVNGVFPPATVASLLVLLLVLLGLCFWVSSLLEWKAQIRSAKPLAPRLFQTDLKAAWISGAVALLALALTPVEVNHPIAPVLIAVAAAAANLFLLAQFGHLLNGLTARCLSRLFLLTPIIPLGLSWAGH